MRRPPPPLWSGCARIGASGRSGERTSHQSMLHQNMLHQSMQHQNKGNTMSNALRFLEAIARDPALALQGSDERDALMASFGLADEERRALRDLDARALAELLGARERMWLMQWPGDAPEREDEPQREDDSPADDDDDEKSVEQRPGALH